MEKVIRLIVSMGVVAVCACFMVYQFAVSATAVAADTIKLYHDPIEAFVGLEMMYFLAGITFVVSMGLFFVMAEHAWVYLLGLIVGFVALMFSCLLGLSFVITGYGFSGMLWNVPWVSFLPLALMVFSGASGFGKRIGFWNWLGIPVALFPFVVMHYDGRYSATLRQPETSAYVFLVYWMVVAYLSTRHVSYRPVLRDAGEWMAVKPETE